MTAATLKGDAGILVLNEFAQFPLGAGVGEARQLGIIAHVHEVMFLEVLVGGFDTLVLRGVVNGDAMSLLATGTFQLLLVEADADLAKQIFVLAEVQVVQLDVAGVGFCRFLRRSFCSLLLLVELLLAFFLQPDS